MYFSGRETVFSDAEIFPNQALPESVSQIFFIAPPVAPFPLPFFICRFTRSFASPREVVALGWGKTPELHVHPAAPDRRHPRRGVLDEKGPVPVQVGQAFLEIVLVPFPHPVGTLV